jgi:hypothetical protein
MDQVLFCYVSRVCPASGGCIINLVFSGLLLELNVYQAGLRWLIELVLPFMILWFLLSESWMVANFVYRFFLSRVVWNHSRMPFSPKSCDNGWFS